jgi:hypothetical protein
MRTRTNHFVIKVKDRRFELTGWKASFASGACIGLFWLVVGTGIWTIGRYIAGMLGA